MTSSSLSSKSTIHYGEIKTASAVIAYMAYLEFTIHYGEIKTCIDPQRKNAIQHLQSTMVRLRHECRGRYVIFPTFTIHYGEIKTIPRHCGRYGATNLQSTMVRLRHQLFKPFKISSSDLQSTMVRLRRLLQAHSHRRYQIYNPLW